MTSFFLIFVSPLFLPRFFCFNPISAPLFLFQPYFCPTFFVSTLFLPHFFFVPTLFLHHFFLFQPYLCAPPGYLTREQLSAGHGGHHIMAGGLSGGQLLAGRAPVPVLLSLAAAAFLVRSAACAAAAYPIRARRSGGGGGGIGAIVVVRVIVPHDARLWRI
jgi:hypothetical protein